MLFFVHDAMTFEQYRDIKQCFGHDALALCPKIQHQLYVLKSKINSIHNLPAQGPYSAGKLRGQIEGRTNTLKVRYKLQTVFKVNLLT